MNSCLYECRVVHARLAPKAHRFAYRLFLFGFDLDELDSLHRSLRLFSRNRANLYSFRDADFLPTHEAPRHPTDPAEVCHPLYDKPPGLKGRVVAHLARHGIDLAGGRVLLVTLPRVFGYLFNPVSFYFCYDRTGEPVAALVEVTNTFREMKPFVLGPACRRDGRGAAAGVVFEKRTPKHFYVSPFSDVDVAFDFSLHTPGERLAIQIDDYAGGARTLTSTLHGARRPLTDAALAWFTLKHPLMT